MCCCLPDSCILLYKIAFSTVFLQNISNCKSYDKILARKFDYKNKYVIDCCGIKRLSFIMHIGVFIWFTDCSLKCLICFVCILLIPFFHRIT